MQAEHEGGGARRPLVDQTAAAARSASWSKPRCTCAAGIARAVPNEISQAPYLKSLPSWLLRGPWAWSAYAFLPVAVLLELTWAVMLASGNWKLGTGDGMRVAVENLKLAPGYASAYRLVFGTALVCTLLYMVSRRSTRWTFSTFTIQSLTFLSLRLFFAGLGGLSSDPSLEPVRWAAAVLRAPALIQASFVVSIWWGVLTPSIYYALRHNAAERASFTAYNAQPFLLLVHLANLPIAAIDFWFGHIPFVAIDLWIVVLSGLCYVIFYLLVLDAHQVHLYFILSPRTAWAAVTYTVLLSLLGGTFVAWNALLAALSGH